MFEKIFNSADNEASNVSSPKGWFINAMQGISDGGQVITPNLALNLSSVYKCIAIRAGTFSKMPIQTFMKTANGKIRIKDSSSYLLEERPNERTTPSQFKKMIMIDVDLWGNSYCLITEKRRSLKRLEPNLVTVHRMSDDTLRYKYNNPLSRKVEVYNQDEVMHFKDFSTDGILGKSKIQIARETIENAKASNKLLSKYYKNGTLSKGILTHPGTLGKEAKTTIKEAWRSANSGIDNAYDIPVVDSGLEYKDISMSFEDAEFLSLNKFSVEEFARFFNVPPYMLGIMDGAKFNNLQSQAMDFITTTMQPFITDVEEEIDYKYYYTLEKKKGIYCKINMSVAMRADDISRAEFYEKMLNNGIYSINKCLSKEDEETIGEEGDKHYRSLNYVDIAVMEEYQLAKAKGGLKGGEQKDEK